MKKLLLLAVVSVLVAGCASSEQKTKGSQLDAQEAKYQIIDQEFDNMLAPESNYEALAPYEEQVGASSYIQSVQKKGTNKPVKKSVVKPARTKVNTQSVTQSSTVAAGGKTVINTNVYINEQAPAAPAPMDENVPLTDEEVLPAQDTPDTL